MFSSPQDVLEFYRAKPDVSVSQAGEAHSIVLSRPDFSIAITIPDKVLEWFVEVTQQDQVVATDWCDYAGYDDTPMPDLKRDMAQDIDRFVKSLLASELRVSRVGKKSILEGLIEGGGGNLFLWRLLIERLVLADCRSSPG